MKNKSHTHTQHGSGKQPTRAKTQHQTATVISAVNRIGHWNTSVQHGRHSATIARRWDTLPKYANAKPSVGQKEISTSDSQTESWPEIDHIHSVNGISRVDFYKAILLVQGQRPEFIIDTGSPVTIIPPIINALEIRKTTKCFVDVNKNPIGFEGESLVEVKTGKCQKTLSILITENEITQPLLGLGWLDQLEIGLQGNNNTTIIRHIETDGRREKIICQHEDLFKNNHTRPYH